MLHNLSPSQGQAPDTPNNPFASVAIFVELYEKCKPLATDPNILDRMIETLEGLGIHGERRLLKLVYLALTSRLLEEPLSLIVKGPSSAGKSHSTKHVLKLFPAPAYYSRTAITPKSLAYNEESFAHRTIVIGEASGFQKGEGALMLRTLLSEGFIRHETVGDGKGKTLEKRGPTNLVSTTTALRVDPELETRLISVPIDDSATQTKAIMREQAKQHSGRTAAVQDLEQWKALQWWLERSQPHLVANRMGDGGGDKPVVIPFAELIADAIPPNAIRLRRDIGKILTLISTHALLHQATRQRNERSQIVATVDDYAAIYELIADLVSEGVDMAVPADVRETVEAVARLKLGDRDKYRAGVPQKELVEVLHRDRSTVSRRVDKAVSAGYLRRTDTDTKETFLALGNPLPTDGCVMPSPGLLRGCAGNA